MADPAEVLGVAEVQVQVKLDDLDKGLAAARARLEAFDKTAGNQRGLGALRAASREAQGALSQLSNQLGAIEHKAGTASAGYVSATGAMATANKTLARLDMELAAAERELTTARTSSVDALNKQTAANDNASKGLRQSATAAVESGKSWFAFGAEVLKISGYIKLASLVALQASPALRGLKDQFLGAFGGGQGGGGVAGAVNKTADAVGGLAPKITAAGAAVSAISPLTSKLGASIALVAPAATAAGAAIAGAAPAVTKLAAAYKTYDAIDDALDVGKTAAKIAAIGPAAATAATGLYVVSPALRQVVNRQVMEGVAEIPKAVGLIAPVAQKAGSALIGSLARNLHVVAGFGLPILAVATAFSAVSEAISTGAEKVAQLDALFKKIQQTDFSNIEFFTRNLGAAKELKLDIDGMAQAMEKFSAAARSATLGRGGGGFDVSAFSGATKEAFQNASSLEAKFRAMGPMLRDALDKGQRLAALDFASKFFPKEVVDRLAVSSDYLITMQQKADELAASKFIDPANVLLAEELKERLDKANEVINAKMFDLTKLALYFRGILVGWTELIADILKGLEKGSELLGSWGVKILSAIPGANALAAALRAAANPPKENVPPATTGAEMLRQQMNQLSVQRALNETTETYNGTLGDTSKSVEDFTNALRKHAPTAKEFEKFFQAEKLEAAKEAFDAAVKRLNIEFVEKGLRTTEDPFKTEEYKKKLKEIQDVHKIVVDKIKEGTKEVEDAWDRAVEGLTRNIAMMKAENQAVGQSAAVLAGLRAEMRLLEAAERTEIGVTKERRAEAAKWRQEIQQLTADTARLRLSLEISRGNKFLFMDPSEVEIAEKLRDVIPDIDKALQSPYATALRFQNTMRETRDLLSTTAVGFVRDLAQGRDLMESMASAAQRIGDYFLEAGIKDLINNVMAAAGKDMLGFSTGATTAVGILTPGIVGAFTTGATAARGVMATAGGGGAMNALAMSPGGATPSIGTWDVGTWFNNRFGAPLKKAADEFSGNIGEAGFNFETAGSSVAADVEDGGAGFQVSVDDAGAGLVNKLGSALGGLFTQGGSGSLGGAVSNLFGGGMMGGLATAGIGVGISLITGFLQKRKQAEEEAKRARATWDGMHADFVLFLDKMAGSVVGRFGQAVAQAQKEMQTFANAAAAAKDFASVAQAQAAFNSFREDQARRFFSTFFQLNSAYTAGNKALADAVIGVQSFADEVRGFIGDTKLFGSLFLDAETAAERLALAQQAARKFALSALSIAPALDEVARQAFELKAKADGLVPILVELGMSAEEAGAAIKNQLITAIQQFDDILNRDINTQMGVGWVNQINDILAKFNAIRVSGMASAEVLDTWLRGALQDVVDQAQLTGDAFQRLISGMPQLTGLIHEFTGAVTMSAQEIADQLRTLENRLFAATNNASTLQGALAAFDRQAGQERLGIAPQNIALFEQVIAAERLNIIKEFRRQAVEAEKQIADERRRALQEAKDFLSGVSRRITEFLNGLLGGSQSPLSPQARLQKAQADFAAQYALAQGGDRDALSGITQFAQTNIEALRAFFGSGSQFHAGFNQIVSMLEALPELVSPEQLIVDAITTGTGNIVSATNTMRQDFITAVNANNSAAVASVLNQYLPLIDTNTNNSISFAEMQQAFQGTYNTGTLRNIFNELDVNHNALIDKEELIRAAAVGTQGNTNVGTNGTGTSISNTASNTASTVTSLSALAQISSSTSATVANTNNLPGMHTEAINATLHLAAIRSGINAMNANRVLYPNNVLAGLPTFHTGGEVQAKLQVGEFVVQKSAAQANMPVLRAINALNGKQFNAGSLPSLNGAAGLGNTDVLNELRSLHMTLRELLMGEIETTARGAQTTNERLAGIHETLKSPPRAAAREAA